MRRALKRDSVRKVSAQVGLPMDTILRYERGECAVLDFYTWVSLASYYGREMLQTPFTVHRLEQAVADVYFMYLGNGEPVQYSAQRACDEMKR